MAEKRASKRKGNPTGSSAKQTGKAAGGSETGDFWVREDGALCWGNECVVVNPDKDGHVDIEINRNRGCDVNAFADAIARTVGKGKPTVFNIKDE